MPTISRFYGISIRMFFNDHEPPHFHAVYGEHEALIEIATGRVIYGRLAPSARRLVREWVLRYRPRLMENWERGRSRPRREFELIPGLDDEDE
jgi:hypothetical protein